MSCLGIVLAGVILASSSEIGIDGDSMFTNNSAGYIGGERGRGTNMASRILRTTTAPVLVGWTALLQSYRTK